jgi:hypothetical protein
VGLDLRFLTLDLPSRLDHRLTHAGPQQQQRQQQVSIELERFWFISSSIFSTAAGDVRQQWKQFAPPAVNLNLRRTNHDVNPPAFYLTGAAPISDWLDWCS